MYVYLNACFVVGGHLYIDLTMQTDTVEFEDKCDELASRINAVKAEKAIAIQQQQQQQQQQQMEANEESEISVE